jgi:hypothetical protein
MRPSIFRHFAASSLIVLMLIGSAASSYAISVHKTEFAMKLQLGVLANDVIVIDIPSNKIGFHTFVYQLDDGIQKDIAPVANAPPSIADN